MLSRYLRKLDTASLSNRINNAGLPTTGNATGNIMYWNGSAWIKLPIGSEGQILKVSGGLPVWGNTDFYCGLTILKDIDNNTYNTVQIGSQCWMKENLRVSSYNDGTLIPIVTGNSAWGLLTTGGRSWINNDSTANEMPYGNLYNWYAAKGIVTHNGAPTKNICPSGWRVPTDQELATNLTTTSGVFSALPGGYRVNDGSFNSFGTTAFFWSATEYYTVDSGWYRYFNFNTGSVGPGSGYKSLGMSIRCLKD
jgi:hypothetical protein